MRARHRHWTPPPPLPLFEPPEIIRAPVFRSDGSGEFLEIEFRPPSEPVDTSWEAAGRIQPHVSQLREQVYQYIASRGEFGATEREIEHGLTLPGNTVRPRLWELEGNAPKDQKRPPVRIAKSPRRRDRMRVYVAL